VSELRVRLAGALPEIQDGDDLPRMLARAAAEGGVVPGDVLVVAHKVVSKAEGRVVNLAHVNPSPAAQQLAVETGKEPAVCELILRESRHIVARREGTLICETHHGFVCATRRSIAPILRAVPLFCCHATPMLRRNGFSERLRSRPEGMSES